MINIPATLIALHPDQTGDHAQIPLRRARLRLVTAGFVGAASMAVVYAFAYLTSDRGLVRRTSTVMLYIALFGMLCLWNIHSIRVMERARSRRTRSFSCSACCYEHAATSSDYILPRWLEFTPPTNEQWVKVSDRTLPCRYHHHPVCGDAHPLADRSPLEAVLTVTHIRQRRRAQHAAPCEIPTPIWNHKIVASVRQTLDRRELGTTRRRPYAPILLQNGATAACPELAAQRRNGQWRSIRRLAERRAGTPRRSR
ncbi:MAG: hypothetical protein U0521_22710 [Anaerolineae bacterium]